MLETRGKHNPATGPCALKHKKVTLASFIKDYFKWHLS